jgi:hypothetical protein
MRQVIKTFNNCKKLLKKDGYFVFDLGLTNIKNQKKDEMFLESSADGKIEIARISQWRAIDSTRSVFKATYLTFIKDGRCLVDFGTDIHELGAFNLDDIVGILHKTGFKQIRIYDGYKGEVIKKPHKFERIPVIIACV